MNPIMLPSDIQTWTRAQPFRPFRIVMNAGGTYDVRHPEMVTILEDAVVHFTPTAEEGVYKRARMLGLQLIDRIETLADAAEAKPQDNGKSNG